MDKTPTETLGIVITENDVTNFKYNFQQRIITLKATLKDMETTEIIT